MINPEIVNEAYRKFHAGEIDREKFARIVLSAAKSLTRSHAKRETQEDINDIAVDATMVAIDCGPEYESFFSRLCLCVKGVRSNWLKKITAQKRKYGPGNVDVPLQDAYWELVYNGAEEIENRVLGRELRDRISKLPTKQREALERYLEDGDSTDATRTAKFVGLQKLIKRMRK